jgi:hypothetical protein
MFVQVKHAFFAPIHTTRTLHISDPNHILFVSCGTHFAHAAGRFQANGSRRPLAANEDAAVSSPTVHLQRGLRHATAHQCSSNMFYCNLIHRDRTTVGCEKACSGASLAISKRVPSKVSLELPAAATALAAAAGRPRGTPAHGGRTDTRPPRPDGSAGRICTTQFAGKCSVGIFRARLPTAHRMKAVLRGIRRSK